MDPLSSVAWVMDTFGPASCITQEESNKFWNRPEEKPDSVFGFFSKGTLRHYLKGRSERFGEEWVLFHGGLSLGAMDDMLQAKKNKGIEIGYLRGMSKDTVVNMAPRRGWMLLCMTPTLVGKPYSEMRSRSHLLIERLRRIVPIEPWYFIEAQVLFAALRNRYFLHCFKKKNEKGEMTDFFFEHLFFDKNFEGNKLSFPLRMAGTNQRLRPSVVRLVGEELDFPTASSGVCFRKLCIRERLIRRTA